MKTRGLKNDLAEVFSGNLKNEKRPRVTPGRINAGSNLYHENSPGAAVREEIDLRFSDFVKGTRLE